MYKRKYQVGYDKTLKQPIYKELTYDFFAENLDWEWNFNYNGYTIDIAWHKEKEKAVYELNINGYKENALRYSFDTPEELLEKGCVDGKTLKEIWNDLEN